MQENGAVVEVLKSDRHFVLISWGGGRGRSGKGGGKVMSRPAAAYEMAASASTGYLRQVALPEAANRASRIDD